MHSGHTSAFWPGHATIMIKVPLCRPDPSNHYFQAAFSFISPFKYFSQSAKYFILLGICLVLKLFFQPKLNQRDQ